MAESTAASVATGGTWMTTASVGVGVGVGSGSLAGADGKEPLSVVLSAIFIGSFSILGNIIALSAIFLQRHRVTQTYRLIANLALSDLFIGIVMLSFTAVVMDKSVVQQETLCAWTYSSLLFCTFASVNALLLITIDRFLIIVHPLRYQELTATPRGPIAVAAAWVSAATLSLLPALNIFGRETLPPTVDCQLFSILTRAYIVFVLFTAYALPLSVMLLLYFKIALVAKKHREQIHALHVSRTTRDTDDTATAVAPGGATSDPRPVAAEPNSNELIESKARSKEQWKATRTIFIVLGYFIVSWLPFYTCMILMSLYGNSEA